MRCWRVFRSFLRPPSSPFRRRTRAAALCLRHPSYSPPPVHSLSYFGKDTKLIYRHYATLYFVVAVDGAESELGMLDLIQVFVEVLDKCFENVCELDLIFHPDKVNYILDEIIMGGMVLDTNIGDVLEAIKDMDALEKVRVLQASARGAVLARAHSAHMRDIVSHLSLPPRSVTCYAVAPLRLHSLPPSRRRPRGLASARNPLMAPLTYPPPFHSAALNPALSLSLSLSLNPVL